MDFPPGLIERLMLTREQDKGAVATTLYDGGVATDYGDACAELAAWVIERRQRLALVADGERFNRNETYKKLTEWLGVGVDSMSPADVYTRIGAKLMALDEGRAARLDALEKRVERLELAMLVRNIERLGA